MLSLREFVGEEYFIWANQQYAEARNYLKNCGKPKDDYEKWLILFHKQTVDIFKEYK